MAVVALEVGILVATWKVVGRAACTVAAADWKSFWISDNLKKSKCPCLQGDHSCRQQAKTHQISKVISKDKLWPLTLSLRLWVAPLFVLVRILPYQYLVHFEPRYLNFSSPCPRTKLSLCLEITTHSGCMRIQSQKPRCWISGQYRSKSLPTSLPWDPDGDLSKLLWGLRQGLSRENCQSVGLPSKGSRERLRYMRGSLLY